MKYFLLLGLLVLPAIISTFDPSPRLFALADEVEDEEDDELVDVGEETDGEETAMTDEGTEEEEDSSGSKSGGSPNADTTILFIQPIAQPGSTLDLPAGKIVEFLVGFLNKGDEDLILETLDASFRYPMDFKFYIQNFTTLVYERPVKPGHEATLSYSFIPAEAFASRPFGLSVNLRYRDDSGNQFYEGVYNETVNIVEIEEGLDGETFFLYVFLGACGVLLLVLGQQFLVSVGKKRVGGGTTTKRPQVETGTTNPNDVDYDWLPRETLQSLNKSPRARPVAKQQSPKQRKAKRTAGSDD
ncbi:translocon-associated protein subunit alpha [Nilaparvata lugens]|uniref:translocon-associated protein subunit alpha n=1 Tax=Nilaparvata lugens TaxID=108931 RepID=UPI000B984F5D|nr:translocon-associated protein subunit alpha [Nilaparvata lugens]